MRLRSVALVLACALVLAACSTDKKNNAFKPADAPQLTPTSASSANPRTTIGIATTVPAAACKQPDLDALHAVFADAWHNTGQPGRGQCGVSLSGDGGGKLQLEFLPTTTAADDIARYKNQRYTPPKGTAYENYGDLRQATASSGAALTADSGTSYFVYLAATNWLVFVEADVPTTVQKTASKAERNAMAKALVQWAAKQQPAT
jgi:hypothetical protein